MMNIPNNTLRCILLRYSTKISAFYKRIIYKVAEIAVSG